MAVLLRDEDTCPPCWLGQPLGAAASARAVGGAATTPVASSKAGARPATRRVPERVRGRALGTLTGDGGVRRDRSAAASGSLPFGGKGMGVGGCASY